MIKLAVTMCSVSCLMMSAGVFSSELEDGYVYVISPVLPALMEAWNGHGGWQEVHRSVRTDQTVTGHSVSCQMGKAVRVLGQEDVYQFEKLAEPMLLFLTVRAVQKTYHWNGSISESNYGDGKVTRVLFTKVEEVKTSTSPPGEIGMSWDINTGEGFPWFFIGNDRVEVDFFDGTGFYYRDGRSASSLRSAPDYFLKNCETTPKEVPLFISRQEEMFDELPPEYRK